MLAAQAASLEGQPTPMPLLLVPLHDLLQRLLVGEGLDLLDEVVGELDAWLAPFRAFWEGRLDALERHLDQES